MWKVLWSIFQISIKSVEIFVSTPLCWLMQIFATCLRQHELSSVFLAGSDLKMLRNYNNICSTAAHLLTDRHDERLQWRKNLLRRLVVPLCLELIGCKQVINLNQHLTCRSEYDSSGLLFYKAHVFRCVLEHFSETFLLDVVKIYGNYYRVKKQFKQNKNSANTIF